jgi:hypothetical protein
MSRRSFVKAVAAAAVVQSVPAGAETEVRTATAGTPTEWAWTSGREYDDPFNQVEGDALVTLPSGGEERVPGFWAGGSTWRVRYAPPGAGTYKVRSACTDAKNRDLHDQQLTLHAEPYGGANAHYKHGPLKIGGGPLRIGQRAIRRRVHRRTLRVVLPGRSYVDQRAA